MVNPEEAIHVGDHPKEDFHGAQQVGLHAVLVDRSNPEEYEGKRIPNLSPLLTYEPLLA